MCHCVRCTISFTCMLPASWSWLMSSSGTFLFARAPSGKYISLDRVIYRSHGRQRDTHEGDSSKGCPRGDESLQEDTGHIDIRYICILFCHENRWLSFTPNWDAIDRVLGVGILEALRDLSRWLGGVTICDDASGQNLRQHVADQSIPTGTPQGATRQRPLLRIRIS